jgi:hypothetical protein
MLDPHGYHRLCCSTSKQIGTESVRHKAHDLVTQAFDDCARSAGLTLTAVQASIPVCPRSGCDSAKKGDVLIRHRIPAVVARSNGSREPEWNGFIGDAALVAMKNEKGVKDLEAMDKRATHKERHYHPYDTVGWVFLSLIASTSCNLSDNCLRLLQFLAELQTERALQYECVGDNPSEVLHMFASRSRAKVACTVAVGTAMRLVGSARDGPNVRTFRRGASYVPVGHFSEVPLFPRGSEDYPFFTSTPLARGAVEFLEGVAGDGSLETFWFCFGFSQCLGILVWWSYDLVILI